MSDLPAVNASLNGLALVLLSAGYLCIRAGQRKAHRWCMTGAFGASCIFLVTYVVHKILVRGVHTRLGADGWILGLYLAMLASHILLAIAIVPMAIVTMRRALRERFDEHRRLARWTWPVWMYVSVTGVLIYFMLYHWFPTRV
ncbi:MAG: DUF420 domain-containing protein [Limisphaerales bacterium]